MHYIDTVMTGHCTLFRNQVPSHQFSINSEWVWTVRLVSIGSCQGMTSRLTMPGHSKAVCFLFRFVTVATSPILTEAPLL